MSFLWFSSSTIAVVLVKPKKSLLPATAYGGVLYNETYIFFQREFYWNLNLNQTAGATVDELGWVFSDILLNW